MHMKTRLYLGNNFEHSVYEREYSDRIQSRFITNFRLLIPYLIRVLTSPSGLPFNDIFPIVSQLEFPNFVYLRFFEKPSNKPFVFNLGCTALYLLLIWCWLKQKCSGWELNLCANCVI